MQFRKPFHLDILILFDNNSWVSGDYIQNVRISFRGNKNLWGQLEQWQQKVQNHKDVY